MQISPFALSFPPSCDYRRTMDEAEHNNRLKRLRFRAWHRGTREADYMIGCFFDSFHEQWGADELTWFENLLEEEDVDILGWALGTVPVPVPFAGPQMDCMRRLEYVVIPR
jgi:antitoxin CptB